MTTSKFLQKAVSLILALCFVLSTAVSAFAKDTVIYGYRVKMSDFDKENTIRMDVSSIELIRVDGYENRWKIIIDGREHAEKSGSSFSTTYDEVYTLEFNGIGTNNAHVDTSYIPASAITEYIQGKIVFSVVNNTQTAKFTPYEGGQVITKTATLTEGYYDFGLMEFVYKGNSYSFEVKINTANNTVYVTRDGKTYTYPILEGNTVYLEWWVDAQEIQASYLDTNLPKLPFEEAKVHKYTDGQIDSALSNYTITMKNNLTGLTHQANLVTTLTYWARKEGTETHVGDGTYNEYTSGVRVVKQWPELTAEQKTYFGGGKEGDVDYARRPFAVFPKDDKFTGIGSAEKTTITSAIQYQNISWPVTAWSEYNLKGLAINAIDRTYGIARYRKADLIWGNFGDWKTYTKIDDACNSDRCKYETKSAYLKTITEYSFAGYSGYNYTSPADAERAGYVWASATTCNTTTKTDSACGVKDYTYSGYSGYNYTSIVDAERAGYSWASSSTCNTTTKTDSACGVSSYTYSGWSGYIYTSKEADERTYASECKSTYTTDSKCGTQASTTTADSNSFSGYYYTSKAEADRDGYSYTKFCESDYRKSSYCGTTTEYDNYTDGTSKHGCKTSKCSSSTKKSSLCGTTTTTTNKTCTLYYGCSTSAGTDCAYFKTSKDRSNEGYKYKTKSESKTSSLCGTTTTTTNKSCTIYSCPTSCVTVNNSCTLYSCPSRMATENKSCYLYSCPSSRTANYNSCTFYSCPGTRTANYNSCTFYSCPGRKDKDSETSSYVDSCSASHSELKDVTCDSTSLIRTKSATVGDYGAWTMLGGYSSLSSFTESEDSEYKYGVNNGSITTSDVKGASTKLGEGSMFIKEVEVAGEPTHTMVAVKKEKAETANYGNRMTAKDIYNEASRLADLAARAENIAQLSEADVDFDYSKGEWQSANLGWSGNETDKRVDDAARASFNQYLNGERFIPWVFITAHWRATKAGIAYDDPTPIKLSSVPVYKEAPAQDDRASLTAYEMTEDDYDDDPPEVIPPDEPERIDTKVIYFDYRDPLTNYDPANLPENWKGYEYLIEQIKNSDFSNAKFQVRLSAEDIKAMREWTHTHDKDENCSMLREFAYIFTKTTPEFDYWLKNGGSCRTID